MARIEPGSYVAIAKEFDFGETKNGNAFIKVEFEICDGPEEGRNISWFGYFTKATAERTLESLRYCGWSGDKITPEMPGLGSTKCMLSVDEEEYDGKVRTRVQWVNQLYRKGSRPLESRLDDGGLAKLNANLGDHLLKSQPIEGAEKIDGAQAARAGSAQADSDDLPF